MKDNPEKYKRNKENIARIAGHRGYKNPLYHDKDNGRVRIDHKAVAHTMVKFINASGIHPTVKKIMTYRLIGIEPTYLPMSHEGVAIVLGLGIQEVEVLEKEGLNMCQDLMNKCSLQDGINKFNENSSSGTDLKNNLKNPL